MRDLQIIRKPSSKDDLNLLEKRRIFMCMEEGCRDTPCIFLIEDKSVLDDCPESGMNLNIEEYTIR